MSTTQALIELFHIYDDKRNGCLSADELHHIFDRIRIGGINLAQIKASMELVCGSTDGVMLTEMKDVFEEMDRRYFLVQDLQWEFALLDTQHRGTISIEKARFLFECVHGKMFSLSKWNRFLRSRVLSDAPVTFAEIEVDLCTLPVPDDWQLDDGGIDRIEELKRIEERRRKLEKAEKRRKKEKRLREDKRKSRVSATDSTLKSLEEAKKEVSLPVGNTDEDKLNQDAILAEKKEMENQRTKEKEEKKKKGRERKKERGPEHKKLLKNLESAFVSKDSKQLEPAIQEYKEGVPRQRDQDELLAKAERLLEMLKCSASLKDAMTQRVIADLESAISRVKKSGFDQSPDELANEVEAAGDMLMRLKRLEKLRKEVLELKQSTIAELRSYQKPIPVIHNVMTATYLLLGTSEKETKDWQNVQALLGKTGREGLKRRIGQCNVLKITTATAKRARDVMGVVDLELIRDVSAGAATFFVWAEGMIEEVENNAKTQ